MSLHDWIGEVKSKPDLINILQHRVPEDFARFLFILGKEHNSYVLRGCNLDANLVYRLYMGEMDLKCLVPLATAADFMEAEGRISDLYRSFSFVEGNFCSTYALGIIYQKKAKIAFDHHLPELFSKFNHLAATLFYQLDCKLKYAHQVMVRGEFNQYQGKNELAIRSFDEALTIFYQNNASALVIATSHFMKGNSLIEMGSIEDGVEEIKKCLRKSLNNSEIRYFALNRLGNLWHSLGSISKSERYHKLIIRLCRTSGDIEAQLKAEANLAGIWLLKGKIDKAETILISFVSEYSLLDLPDDRHFHNIGYAYFQLSQIHGQRGDMVTALHFTRMALSTWQKISIESIKIIPMLKGFLRLIAILLEMSEYEEAKSAFDQFVSFEKEWHSFPSIGHYKLFMRILFMRISKRLAPRLSAESLCKQLLSNKGLPFDLRFDIHWVLIDTLLEEFQYTLDFEILFELKSCVEAMKALAKHNNLKIEELNLQFFEAKLSLYKNHFSSFFRTVAELKNKGQKMKLDGFVQKTCQEEEEVKKRLMSTYSIVHREKEQVEAIRESNLNDFISHLNSRLRHDVKKKRLNL